MDQEQGNPMNKKKIAASIVVVSDKVRQTVTSHSDC